MRQFLLSALALHAVAFVGIATPVYAEPVLVPQIEGDFWQIAGDPDLGKYTTGKQ